MKTAKKTIYSPLSYFTALFLIGVLFVGCEAENQDEEIDSQSTENLTDIEGEYLCSGECITTVDGNKVVVTVTGENDDIKRYPGAKEELYKVEINSGKFHEVELGALCERTLRTATAAVSDSTYPVLEEFVFNTNESGEVIGFTKTVRNPNHDNFKTCVIYGKKVMK